MTLTEDRTFSFRQEGKDYGYAFAATATEEPEKLVERADAEQSLTELVASVPDFVGSR